MLTAYTTTYDCSSFVPLVVSQSRSGAEDYHWMKPISGGVKGEVKELYKTTNGTKEEQSYVVVYAVNIHHYQYEDVTRVVIGTSRIEARKIMENLIKELNENNSKIKEITA